MSKRILLEEFHLSVYVNRSFPEVKILGVRRQLCSKRFQAALKSAILQVCRQRSLAPNVKFIISR